MVYTGQSSFIYTQTTPGQVYAFKEAMVLTILLVVVFDVGVVVAVICQRYLVLFIFFCCRVSRSALCSLSRLKSVAV